MSLLERAVADLADALDTLEGKIGDRFQSADGSENAAAMRQIKVARERADDASHELSDAITELKSILDTEAQ